MNQRYTLLLFLVFVALAGYVFYFERDSEPVDLSAGPPTPTAEPLFGGLAGADIEEVEVDGPDGSYVLTRVAGGWEVDGEAAAEEVDGVVTRLAAPTIRRVLADVDADDYGFATLSLTVTLRTAGGDEHVLEVGDKTPLETDYYVREAGDERIMLVGPGDIDRLMDWALEPPLAPTPTPETAATSEAGDGDAAGEGYPAAGDEAEGEEGYPAADEGAEGDEAAVDDAGATEADDDASAGPPEPTSEPEPEATATPEPE